MSFSSDCKLEMSKTSRGECCKIAFLYGVLAFSKAYALDRITISSARNEILDELILLFDSVGVPADSFKRTVTKKNAYAEITDRLITDRLLSDYGYSGEEPFFQIHRDLFSCKNCYAAFLSGCFVSGGTITAPKSGYHMEFATHKKYLFSDLCEILAGVGFEPKKTTRGYFKIAYFKDSETIEDLLIYFGAPEASMELMNYKIYKEIVNNTNRAANCEFANIDKIVASSVSDRADIEFIRTNWGRGVMSEELEVLADLRLAHPDLPLGELGKLLDPPITKSGVSHRLSKIRMHAKRLRETSDGTD